MKSIATILSLLSFNLLAVSFDLEYFRSSENDYGHIGLHVNNTYLSLWADLKTDAEDRIFSPYGFYPAIVNRNRDADSEAYDWREPDITRRFTCSSTEVAESLQKKIQFIHSRKDLIWGIFPFANTYTCATILDEVLSQAFGVKTSFWLTPELLMKKSYEKESDCTSELIGEQLSTPLNGKAYWMSWLTSILSVAQGIPLYTSV